MTAVIEPPWRSPVPAPSSPSSTRRSSTSPSPTSRPPSPARGATPSPGCSTATSSSSPRCWCRPAASPTASATGASSCSGSPASPPPACSARVAPSLPLLIAFRVLQGVGAAMIAPASLAIVLDSFPVERRSAGVGLWGAAAAAAAAIGPTLGGALVELSDWRLVFLVNLPLGVAIVFAGRSRLPRPALLDSRLPDLPGAAMLALSLATVTLGIVEGNDWGWASVRHPRLLRRRRAPARRRRRPQPPPPAPDRRAGALRPPLLPRRQPRHPALRRRLLLADPRQRPLPHLDLGLHHPAGGAGGAAGAGALDRGRRPGRPARRSLRPPRRRRPRHARLRGRDDGPALGRRRAGLLGLWLPGACLTGIGIGLAFPTLGAAAVRDVPVDRFATASAVNAAFRQVGAVLGTAILVAIVGEPASLPESLDVRRLRLPLRGDRLAGLRRRRARPAPAASARRARPRRERARRCGRRRRSRSPRRRPRLAASPPSSSRTARSPLTRKPPLASPKSASSGEQPRSRRGWTSTRQPMPPAIAHSARAQARPPSLTSWTRGEPAGADPLADDRAGGGDRVDVGLRQPGLELAALLGQLGAGEHRREGADQPDRVALAQRRRCRRRAPGSGSSPTMPTTGVG